MSGYVPTWAIAIQFVVAGGALGSTAVVLSLLHAGFSAHGGPPDPPVRWLPVWSLTLASVGLVSGTLLIVDGPGLTRALLAIRLLMTAAAILLVVPVLGIPTHPTLAAAILAWYAAGAAAVLGTELGLATTTSEAMAVHGLLSPVVHGAPVIAVMLYVALRCRNTTPRPSGILLTALGASAVILVGATVPAPSVASELACGIWMLPAAIGLQAVVSKQVRAVRATTMRRDQMRDVIARVADLPTPAPPHPDEDEVLDQARREARHVLDGLPVRVRTVPGTGTRDEVQLWTDSAPPCVHSFLADLSRVTNASRARIALTARLNRARQVDLLTGLPSRRGAEEHLSGLSSPDAQVAVMVIDVEALTRVNDRLGRHTGDAVLIHVARHLSAQLPGSFLARIGGDEFAAVVTGAPSTQDLRNLALDLRGAITDVPGAGRTRLTVGTAHGGAHPVEALRHAEVAMSEARRTHTGYAHFDERLRSALAEHEALYTELERAVTDGNIVAHFQPLADPSSLQPVGLEALARWRDGDDLRSPASWLPLAEDTGLIVEIGRQMLAQARQALQMYGLPVSVNVSACQLDDPDVLTHIEQGWGTDAWDMLTIEVTESAFLHDVPRARAALSLLAERGVRIALDDFGSGYNSLARLGTLPLHVLKIDQTLVQQSESAEGVAVLRAAVDLARAHGLKIVAEGVERRAQLTVMLDLGVDAVQGHLTGRPQAYLRGHPHTPTQWDRSATRTTTA